MMLPPNIENELASRAKMIVAVFDLVRDASVVELTVRNPAGSRKLTWLEPDDSAQYSTELATLFSEERESDGSP